MSVTVTPATIVELAELAGARTRQEWGDARALMDAGELYAFRAGNELLAIGGFVPIPGTDNFANMVFNPAPACRRHALGFLAAARLTILAAPYRGILTVCGSEAGKLFARRLGFTFKADTDFGEVWAYGSSVREQRESATGRPAAAGGADRREPADEPRTDRSGTGPA